MGLPQRVPGQKRRYFAPEEWENQDRLEPEVFYREIREVFSRNLPRYFEGREPVGMSLTGGLDTRMIMAWQKSQPGSFPVTPSAEWSATVRTSSWHGRWPAYANSPTR